MQTEAINAENFSSIELDDNYFKFCTFEDLSPEGGLIASDLNGCAFQRVDWYWGLFSECNFIECRFTDCTFRGCNFASCRFVECVLANCQFVKDNVNRDCDFDGSVAYNCKLENCQGFHPRFEAIQN